MTNHAEIGQTSVPLSTGVRVGYGFGSVATGAFGTVPGLMLLPYLTDTLGIAAALAGVLVFLPKAWDVVLNPIAGRISDRSSDPRGPRRPFLLRAGLPLAVTFALLFAGPPLGSRLLDGLWVLVLFLLCSSAYSFFQVPYISMPAEITDSYHERTRLMSWRVGILALTILMSGASAPAVRDALGGQAGYRAMGVLIGAFLLIGALGAYVGTRNAPVGPVSAGAGSLGDQLRVVAAAREFRLLLAVFVIQALATSTLLAGVAYVSRWVLVDEAATTLLFVCFIAPALLLTPVWSRIGRRLGKARGYLASSLVLAVAAFLLLLSNSAPNLWTYAVAALAGVGYAGIQIFPMAMLPDVTAADAERTGESRNGVFAGIWTAGETLGLALGPAVYALALALGSYRSSDVDDWTAQQQPSSAVTAIVLGFSLVPGLLLLLSLLPLRRLSRSPDSVSARAEPSAG